MSRNSASLSENRYKGTLARAIPVLLLTALPFAQRPALAADEECDTTTPAPKYATPADNLCVPAIASKVNFVVNGSDSEWAAGTFYDHDEYNGGGSRQARVRVSRKATGVGRSDLFLFFDVTGDNLATGLDEIRIGLNPGTTPANTTLIKIHPFPVAPTPFKAAFTFNPGAAAWTAISDAWLPMANISVAQNVAAATWRAEIKISLDQIPSNPIAGDTFRLHLELFSHDNVSDPVDFQWPPQYGYAGEHNNICSNPERAHPMSFATGTGANCPHADVHIAGGLYSCGDVYIRRGGAKSNEIAVSQMNEFHADVTNDPASEANATDVEVYLTILQLGISTAPIAMNFNHVTDTNIVNFFHSKYGAWMTATDKLDTGSPSPPPPFNVNTGATNIDARYNWRPSDETRFGPPANFVGSHKCTAAFVNFKDDPNFANNFSFCNTSIVNCPTGQNCIMSFEMAQNFPYFPPKDDARALVAVTAFNEPSPGWLKSLQLRMEAPGLERIRENLFEVRLPARRGVPVRLTITPPRVGRNEYPGGGGLIPAVHAASLAEPVGERGSDPVRERQARLRRIYGDRPMVIVEGFMPTAYETGLDGTSRVPLYGPTSYVAFVVNTKPTQPPPQGGGCGRSSTRRSVALASVVALLGLASVWQRTTRRRSRGSRAQG
jgi:hypothetical protein